MKWDINKALRPFEPESCTPLEPSNERRLRASYAVMAGSRTALSPVLAASDREPSTELSSDEEIVFSDEELNEDREALEEEMLRRDLMDELRPRFTS